MAKTYRIGPAPFKGHKPGSTAKIEFADEAQEERAIARGSLSLDTSADSLEKKKRPELEQLARAAGVSDPEKLENKAAVVQAIRDKNKE